jgi:hypothetical protein
VQAIISNQSKSLSDNTNQKVFFVPGFEITTGLAISLAITQKWTDK